MIHKGFSRKWPWDIIYQGFEEYIKSLKSKSIRIDVVTNYDSSVLKFWTHNGFVKLKNIELNWAGKTFTCCNYEEKIIIICKKKRLYLVTLEKFKSGELLFIML